MWKPAPKIISPGSVTVGRALALHAANRVRSPASNRVPPTTTKSDPWALSGVVQKKQNKIKLPLWSPIVRSTLGFLTRHSPLTATNGFQESRALRNITKWGVTLELPRTAWEMVPSPQKHHPLELLHQGLHVEAPKPQSPKTVWHGQSDMLVRTHSVLSAACAYVFNSWYRRKDGVSKRKNCGDVPTKFLGCPSHMIFFHCQPRLWLQILLSENVTSMQRSPQWNVTSVKNITSIQKWPQHKHYLRANVT